MCFKPHCEDAYHLASQANCYLVHPMQTVNGLQRTPKPAEGYLQTMSGFITSAVTSFLTYLTYAVIAPCFLWCFISAFLLTAVFPLTNSNIPSLRPSIVTRYLSDLILLSSPPYRLLCTTVRLNKSVFIVFTSGTTGKPKSIVLEHFSIYTCTDVMGSNT